MRQHSPDFSFGFRLPTDVAAHIRAAAVTVDGRADAGSPRWCGGSTTAR
jgi:hypothetical protein